MKNIIKGILGHCSFAAALYGMILCIGCSKVLDKKVLNNIQDQAVWKDTVLMQAYMNNLYLDIPAWNTSLAGYTDESRNGGPVTNGTISPDNTLWYWPYNSIRKCNSMLANLNAAAGSEALKGRFEGEARFIRAWQYFEMIRRFGGVPLITEPQALTDSIFSPRDKTSTCVKFIVDELTQAAALLPAVEAASNVGRVSKEAALSLKARVLMDYASPRFNPAADPARWKAAYEACKEALTQLDQDGYGLLTPYKDIFLKEMNKEVIFAIRFNNPGRTQGRDAAVRPISQSVNATGADQPSQELVNAYPTAMGTDANAGLSYQDQWAGRDQRFYATIVYNGANYFGTQIWTYANGTIDGYGAPNGTSTGYYSRKGVDTTLTAPQGGSSGTDFIAIRYADILMLKAEAANELGKTQEAYTVLESIRARAGIAPGTDQLYGLQPGMNQLAMRKRIWKERFVEFAFEQIRFWDLLRWDQLGPVLNGKVRHGLLLTKIAGEPSRFHESLEEVDHQALIIQNNSMFYPLQRSELQNNPNLEQTKGWENGSFDPLQ